MGLPKTGLSPKNNAGLTGSYSDDSGGSSLLKKQNKTDRAHCFGTIGDECGPKQRKSINGHGENDSTTMMGQVIV